MAPLIPWLTFGVFFCGAIGYLSWFAERVRAAYSRLYSPTHSTVSERSDFSASRTALRWYERILFLVVGACFAGFIFAGALHSYLSPPERPFVPEIALGYTYLFRTKHGDVYGTYFEYLVVNYGIWVTWGGALVIGALIAKLKIPINRKSPMGPLFLFAGSAVSMVLYYAIWQVCLHAVPS